MRPLITMTNFDINTPSGSITAQRLWAGEPA